MAYETGTASSLANLQTKIETFLTVTAGYTLTSGILTKTGTLIHVKFEAIALSGRMTLEMGKGSSAGTLLHTHPVLSESIIQMVGISETLISGATAMAFPINYYFQHLTTNGEMFRCVIEYNDGFTQNIGFGEVVKAVNYYGGVYIDASSTWRSSSGGIEVMGGWIPNSPHLTWLNMKTSNASGHYGWMSPLPFGSQDINNSANYAASTQLWAEVSGLDWYTIAKANSTLGGKFANLPAAQITLKTSGFSDLEAGASLQTYNANNTLVPIRLFGHTADGNYQRLGDVPDIRWTNIKNLNFGQVLDDGTDKWKCYPAYKKNATQVNSSTDNDSGQIGFAVRYDGP